MGDMTIVFFDVCVMHAFPFTEECVGRMSKRAKASTKQRGGVCCGMLRMFLSRPFARSV